MIEAIRIQNYRCLRDVTITFSPLTALVGPNGSGKTAILDALVAQLGVPAGSIWRQSRAMMSRSGRADGREFAHQVGPDQSLTTTEWSFLKLAIRPVGLRRPILLQEAGVIDGDASNIANVFASLPRTKQGLVAARLRELVPIYADVGVRPHNAGTHRLVFQDRWEPAIWYEPWEVSEGTLVLLVFLVLAHLDKPPDVIGIEDPEQALHPYLVGEVVGLLRQLATGELGPKPVQVVLATHSAQLLNFLQPEEVRFVSRSLEDGGTVVRSAPTGSDDWAAAYSEYQESLGEMWLSGGLGGVPGIAPTQ